MANTAFSAVMLPMAANIGEIKREIEVVPITAPIEEPSVAPATPAEAPAEKEPVPA